MSVSRSSSVLHAESLLVVMALLLAGLPGVSGVLGALGGCASGDRTPVVAAAALPPHAADVQVNAFTASTQENVALDVARGGNIIVAWDSRRQQQGRYGVYARLLNGRGEPLGPEVQVNVHTAGHQSKPAVAATPDGGAWIAWTSVGQDGDQGAVVARRFDRTLRPLGGEIAVNVTREGHQADPSIAINGRGDALIAWMSTDGEGRARIVARLFGPDGAVQSGEVEIGAGASIWNSVPSVAAQADGEFLLAWNCAETSRDASRILLQRISAEGRLLGAPLAASESPGSHFEPSIDSGPDGCFAVTWIGSTVGGEPHRVFLRRFNADVTPAGPAIQVSQHGEAWVSGAAVASGTGGESLVAWNTFDESARTRDVVARRFTAKGEPVGDPMTIHREREGDQALQAASSARRIATGPSGQVAIGWCGDAGAGDDTAAAVTVFAPESLVVETPNPVMLAAAPAHDINAPIPPIYDPEWKPLPPLQNLLPPGPDFGFPGVDFTGWTPPDPELAVGPQHLVMMTNGAIAFFDMQGNLLFQDEIEGGGGFWGAQGAGGFVFDPEALYDPHTNRFFAMACERTGGRSFYLLAVSDDSDPNGTWHKYRIDVTNIDSDIDSPNMAVDANVVYLSADFFGPDKYQVLMIEKAPLLSGGPVNSREVVIVGSGEQSMGMPIIYDAAAPAGYLIQSSEGTGNGLTFSEVRFHAIQNQLTSPTRVTVDVAVPTYSYPNSPPQQGTSNRPFLFEPRFWSAMYVNGSMWAVHHVNGDRARARWYEFEMNGWPDSGSQPTLRQWGELDYGDPVHTYFPSIAADAEGNAVIFFARSSPVEFISIGRAFRRHNDALGTFRPMEFVKESTVPYTGSGRWGDYSHVEPQPNSGGVFWGTHEWTDTSNAWRTWISEVRTIGSDFAVLLDFDVIFGVLLEGGLYQLGSSDDEYFRVRSGFAFGANDPYSTRINFTFVAAQTDPARIIVRTEAKLNTPGGEAALRLNRWSRDRFRRVDLYPIGVVEETRETMIDSPGEYIRDADGVIEAQLRYAVVASFSLEGFIASIDRVEVEVPQ